MDLNLVLDTVMTRILPKRREYAARKFEVSEEFNKKTTHFDSSKQEPLLEKSDMNFVVHPETK
jgi:hypothetical protein